MFWLIIPVNFSTSIGQESLNRLICEITRETNAAIIKKVSSITNAIAATLLILNRTRKSTTGLSIMAIMVAKTIGIIMLLAIYNIAIKANDPIRKIVTFA